LKKLFKILDFRFKDLEKNNKKSLAYKRVIFCHPREGGDPGKIDMGCHAELVLASSH
jgi:hypothetical protein